MRRLLIKILSSRLPSLLWTLYLLILLCLPGNMLPDEKQFKIPQMDKYVHIILFGCFVFFWGFYYGAKQKEERKLNKLFLTIFITGCILGIALEFVQKYFIPNRDFDIYDIAADIVGAGLGLLVILKSKPLLKQGP
jgi:VanZ family protein